MCNTDNTNRRDPNVTRVIIAGAGPAGLLLSALLLQRNDENANAAASSSAPSPRNRRRYSVTLVDSRQDLGLVPPDELAANHRSWMIGLAGHGLNALREVPELYNDYVDGVGVLLKSLSIHLGSKEMKQTADGSGNDGEGYIVDRNFVVAAMGRYLNERKQSGDGDERYFRSRYGTSVQYVDGENRRVLLRCGETKVEEYEEYDLLVGCDGIRSVVREALTQRHRDFEVSVSDIFSEFKAVHVPCPKGVDPASLHLLPAVFPMCQGIALPETGNQLNISVGVPRHKFATIAPELLSDDPEVLANYVKENFKAFELEDYNDFARQWIGQGWNRTGQVHCNFYHSNPLGIVIMGDAAHATSPAIGMGMNTALRDAQAFYRLLGENNDDLDRTLPAFSGERVKEGNSLTDLAMNLYCVEEGPQLRESVHMVTRITLHKWFPRLISEHPQSMIGQSKYELSDVYEKAVSLGIMSKHRRINDRVRQEHFEAGVGMVKKDGGGGGGRAIWAVALGGLVTAGAWAYTR